MTKLRFLAILLAAACPTGVVLGESPADRLLRLVPPDVAAVALVENLRDEADRIGKSSVAQGLRGMPAVSEWLDSDDFRRFTEARGEIERALQVTWRQLRDDVFGDAVLLALRAPQAEGLSNAEGIVLLVPRDRGLLARLLEAINERAHRDRRLGRVELRNYRGVEYHGRVFGDDEQPSDCYAFLPGGIFAWSSTESSIRGLIDRQSHGGLGELPSWIKEQRAQLPHDSIVTLMAGGALLDRALRDGHARAAGGAKTDAGSELALDVLRGIESYGMALRWREYLELQALQVLNLERFPVALRALLEPMSGAPRSPSPIPPRTIGVISGTWSYARLFEAIRSSVPEAERARVVMLESLLSGIALGLNVHDELAPALGPESLLLALECGKSRTGMGPRWPETVLSVELTGGARVAAALANALRTVFALASLDPKQSAENLRLSSSQEDDTWTIRWSSGEARAFVVVTPSRVLVGSSEDAVRGMQRATLDEGVSILQEMRAAGSPNSLLFAGVDHAALVAWMEENRAWLVSESVKESGETEEVATRDLDGLVALLRLFRASGLRVATEESGHRVRETLRLVPADRFVRGVPGPNL